MNLAEKALMYVVAIVLVVGVPWYVTRSFQAEMDAASEKRRSADAEKTRQGLAIDEAKGFSRIDGGTSGVAIYRDNMTGCEWISLDGRNLKERTTPDAQGVNRQICGEGK